MALQEADDVPPLAAQLTPQTDAPSDINAASDVNAPSVIDSSSNILSDLEEQINELLAPWVESSEKPPFDYEQLVVMALATLGPLTGEEIQKCIMRGFEYYREIAFNAATAMSLRSYCIEVERSSRKSRVIGQGILKVFENFELPVECIAMPNEIDNESRIFKSTWSISPAAARIFLAPLLDALATAKGTLPPTKPFRFLDLPPELRNHIYEDTLCFPGDGLLPRNSALKVLSSQPQHRSDVDPLACVYRGCCIFRGAPVQCSGTHHIIHKTRPLNEVLALFQVNKQVYEEAMPIFYGKNKFIFRTMASMNQALNNMTPKRLEQISRFSFAFDPRSHASAAKAFKALIKMEKLEHLEIWIWENLWSAVQSKAGTQKYPDLLKLPGLSTLRSIKNLKSVTFHGQCVVLQSLASEMIVKPKEDEIEEKEKPKASRKRKAATTAPRSKKAKAT